jgi:hypothetical protein
VLVVDFGAAVVTLATVVAVDRGAAAVVVDEGAVVVGSDGATGGAAAAGTVVSDRKAACPPLEQPTRTTEQTTMIRKRNFTAQSTQSAHSAGSMQCKSPATENAAFELDDDEPSGTWSCRRPDYFTTLMLLNVWPVHPSRDKQSSEQDLLSPMVQ